MLFSYPPISLNSILSRMPSVPGMKSPRPSFAFARFSNERISTINIGQTTAGELQRTEKVDAEAKPIDADVPESSSSGFGFSNVTYDIIGIGAEATSSTADDNVTLAASQNTSAGGRKQDKEEEHIYDLVEVTNIFLYKNLFILIIASEFSHNSKIFMIYI